MTRNLQSAFDHVVTSLFNQGRKCVDAAASCVYSADDGERHCALGWLISSQLDDLPAKTLEHYNGLGFQVEPQSTNIDQLALIGWLTLADWPADKAARQVYSELQGIHDGSGPEQWPDRLRELAKEHKLSSVIVGERLEFLVAAMVRVEVEKLRKAEAAASAHTCTNSGPQLAD